MASYRILRELGAGGMGTVYEAHDEKMNRRVAIKLLSRHLGQASKASLRFEQEAWIAGRLDHPNLVRVFDRGQEDELSFYVMELVTGGSLNDVIGNLKRWGRDDRLRLEFGSRDYVHWAVNQVVAVARALDFAHKKGVVHRDIKPMNLLLDGEHGTIKVADFGLAIDSSAARMTTEGRALGTLAYMAPEQVLGRHGAIGARTDVYALGVTLFELLTLELPYVGGSEQLYLAAVLTSPARRPSRLNQRVGRDLETVIVKCLEKDPRDRYVSAADLADDLENVLLLRPILARPQGRFARSVKWVRRKPLHAALGVLVVFAAVVGALLVTRDLEARRLARESRIVELSTELLRLAQRGFHRETEEAATGLLAIDPQHVAALRSRAIARFHLAEAIRGQPEAASIERDMFADVDALVALEPNASWPLTLRAYFLDQVGRSEDAAAAQVTADQISPAAAAPDDLYFDALLALDSGDLTRAEVLLSEVAALRPNDVQAIALRGEVRRRNGQPARAAEDYRLVLALNPNDFWATCDLGVVLTRSGALEEGERYLRRAAELRPTDVTPLNALSMNAVERARQAIAAGDTAGASALLSEARARAERAVNLGPDAWTHVNLAASLMEQYRLLEYPEPELAELALRHNREAVTISAARRPGGDAAARAAALINLCDALIQLRRAGEAVAACEEITREQPTDALGFYNLAGAYALSGRVEDALVALERNVDLGDREVEYLEKDSWFDSLRNEARFRAILTRMREDR